MQENLNVRVTIMIGAQVSSRQVFRRYCRVSIHLNLNETLHVHIFVEIVKLNFAKLLKRIGGLK